MDYKTELEIIANKVMESPAEIVAYFEKTKENLVAMGMTDERAAQTAFRQVKGSYTMQLRSKAIPVEGFFVAVDQTKNKNKFMWDDAQKYLEEYKATYGGEWKVKAISEGIINEKGECLYHAGLMKKGQEEKMKWMLKQVIHETVLEKMAWGFFRPIAREGEEAQPLRFGIVRIKDVGKLHPEIGWLYRFRASVPKPEENMNMNTVSVTEFERVEYVHYETMYSYIEDKFKIGSFNDAFDFGQKAARQLPDGQPFWITEATVVGIRVLDNADVNMVDFMSLADDDYDDNISMAIPKINDNTFENAIGLIIYKPYFKKNDEKTPSASLYGFLHNPAFGEAPKSTKEISSQDFE